MPELNLACITKSPFGCDMHLLEHDKLILRIIPLANLLLVPEAAHSYDGYQPADHRFI